jgi:transposase
MKEISTIGLDLAKSLFQIHGIGSEDHVVVRRQLRRGEVLGFFARLPRCLIGMEACSGAHYWAREITALGHEVRLIPPAYVKPCVKRGKTDAADAEAICEAVTRPTMRFVAVKSAEQQASAMVLKTRDLLVRQRSQTINALRAHLGELGIVAGTGVAKVAGLIAIVRDHEDMRLPPAARFALKALADQIDRLTEEVQALERQLVAEVRRDDSMRRLTTIPGVGTITAAAVKALVPDIAGFTSARHFAAWMGLTPKPHSSGGKERLGSISKMGNATLRTLLIVGATAVLRHVRRGANGPKWLIDLLARRPAKVVAVALANKMARIIFALLTRGGEYRKPEWATGMEPAAAA